MTVLQGDEAEYFLLRIMELPVEIIILKQGIITLRITIQIQTVPRMTTTDVILAQVLVDVVTVQGAESIVTDTPETMLIVVLVADQEYVQYAMEEGNCDTVSFSYS